MKRMVIEGAVLAALVWSLAACERDAVSGERRSGARDKGHDAGATTSQVFGVTDGGPKMAPEAPLQFTGGGGTGGTGGTVGTGGTGGPGGSGGSSTGGTGGMGGMNAGGASGTGGSY
jgi:hypothetical protein